MRSRPLAGGWGSVGPVVVCRKGVMALVRWRVHRGVGRACGGTWVRGAGWERGGQVRFRPVRGGTGKPALVVHRKFFAWFDGT